MNTKKIRRFILLILLCGLLCVVSAQAQQGHFRVTLNGFFVNHQTFEGVRVTDGMGDEVSLFSHFGLVDLSGRLLLSSIGNIDGGTIGAVPPNSLQFGTASTTGGLLSGNGFPSMQPWRRVITTNRSPTPPTLLFDGDIVRGSTAAVIIPTIWEWDSADNLDFKNIYNGEVTGSSEAIAGHVRPLINNPPPLDLAGFLRSGESLGITPSMGIPPSMLLAYGVPQDRPIGMRESGVQFGFAPRVLVLTYETADFISRTGFGSETGNVVGVVPVRYVDASGLGGGDYTLFLQVERLDVVPNACDNRIRVADAQNVNIRDAEVFVNGRQVGTTDVNGIVRVPVLNVGDRILARSRVHENRTYRSNHQTGSSQNWNYRVYLTTATVGNDGTRADFVVSTVCNTQELRLNPGNPLVGMHIVTSMEWDASVAELDNMRDQILVPASQFLYNSTDGQFFVEQIELADNAAFWDDTDFRIYANLEVRPHVNLRTGGFLHAGWATWMNMRRGPTLMTDPWFSAITAGHEFGHYGFDLKDEYADGDPGVFCATNLGSFGQFGNNQPQASCMMSSQFRAGKLCSGRAENRHRTRTWQGDENCWLHLANQYRDGSDPVRARWLINTPDTRGAIPASLPALPDDWQPRVTIENRSRPNLCQPITIVVRDAGTNAPINNVDVWVRTLSGQSILQGKSGSYQSGGGLVSFGAGSIPITGFHVGDRVAANGGEYVIAPADCSVTARLEEKLLEKRTDGWSMTRASFSPFSIGNENDKLSLQKAVSLLISPEPFALTAGVETAKNGQLQIKVNADGQLYAAPEVVVTRQGSTFAQRVAMTFDDASKSYFGTIDKLSDVAYVNVEVTASMDGKSFVRRFFSAVFSPLNPNDETDIFSTDGQLSASIPTGALPADTKLSVSPSSVPPPSLDSGYVLISDGYNIAASTGEQMRREGIIRFQLPNRQGARASDGFDTKTFEILHYNRQSQKWEAVGGTFLPEVDVISVRTKQLGDYAVVARLLSGSSDGQKNNEKKSSADFTVTDAGLKADEAKVSGKCPVLVKFNGYITTNAPGTVKYTFTRSDGATAPIYTLDFKEAGTQTVSTDWTLGDASALPLYEGWQAIKILSPNEMESSHKTGAFVMNCVNVKLVSMRRNSNDLFWTDRSLGR